MKKRCILINHNNITYLRKVLKLTTSLLKRNKFKHVILTYNYYLSINNLIHILIVNQNYLILKN